MRLLDATLTRYALAMHNVAVTLLAFLFCVAVPASAQDTPTPSVIIVITPTPDGPPTEAPTATPTFTETPVGWDVVAYATVQIGEGDEAESQRLAFRFEMTLGEFAIAVLLALIFVTQLIAGLLSVWKERAND